MTRLASIAKAGFYPTPPPITALIADHISAPHGGRILDPCAGAGMALIHLANTLKLVPYANELDTNRAQQAKNLISSFYKTKPNLPHRDGETTCITGPLENLNTEAGAFNFVFLNPPYDTDDEARRLEYAHLKYANHWLQDGGLLIFIIPETALRLKAMNTYLASWYPNLEIRRFPDPEYDAFKQYIITGTKNKRKQVPEQALVERLHAIGTGDTQADIYGSPDTKTYTLPLLAKTAPPTFRPNIISPIEAAAELKTHGAATLPDMAPHINPNLDALSQFSPLMPLKTGHMAGLIAAGYLDNHILTDDDRGIRLLIKGRTYRAEKSEKQETTDDEGKTTQKITTTQLPVTDIQALTPDGQIIDVKPHELADFLNTWLPQLSQAVVNQYQPQYKFEETIFAQRIGSRGSLKPTQLHVAAATALRLSKHNDALIAGEMGTGKTRTAAAIIPAIQARRSLVICPPHLMHKWVREIEITNPDMHVITIESITDLDKWMKFDDKKQPTVAVMKFTTARAGSGWSHAVNFWKLLTPKEEKRLIDHINAEREGKPLPELTPELQRKKKLYTAWAQTMTKRGVRCATTGTMLTDSNGNPLIHDDLLKSKKQHSHRTVPYISKATTRNGYNRKNRPTGIARFRARYCPAYQETRNTRENNTDGFARYAAKERELRKELKTYGIALQQRSTPKRTRYPLASLIANKYKNQIDLLIADEVHQLKGHDTDQGYAYGRLSAACKKTLGLTGTIYGGKASTLFPILYRMAAEVRDQYTEKDEVGRQRVNVLKWVNDHGMIQTIETITIDANGKQTGNKRNTSTTREAPGSSPTILPWLLNRTAFMSLADMGQDLPPYEEIPITIPMTLEMELRHKQITSRFKDIVVQRLIHGDRSLLGAYLQTSLCWPDAPWRKEIVYDPKTKTDPKPKIVFELEPLDDQTIYPKEQEIIRLAKDEVAQGRNVLLLCQQTRIRDITPRWMELLKNAGLRPAVLRADADKREAWIDQAHLNGINVIIAHPKAVETGLDILHYPTVIWMGTEYSVYTVMQASRRPYRIIQDKPVKVYFFVYENTMQETSLHLIAKKAAAAIRVNGDVIPTNSVADLDMGNIEDQLAKQLLNGQHEQQQTAGTLADMFTAANDAAKQTQTYMGNYQMPTPVQAITQPEPAPKPTPKLPDGWKPEDIAHIITEIEKGRMILVSDPELNIPTIHDPINRSADHLGFGVFKVVTPDAIWTFTGGGAMERTPNGKGYTSVGVNKGSFPYDKANILTTLRQWLSNPSATPQPIEAPPATPQPIEAPPATPQPIEPQPATPQPIEPQPATVNKPPILPFDQRKPGHYTDHPVYGTVKVLGFNIKRYIEANYLVQRYGGHIEQEGNSYAVYQHIQRVCTPEEAKATLDTDTYTPPQTPTAEVPKAAATTPETTTPAAPETTPPAPNRNQLIFGTHTKPKPKNRRKPTSHAPQRSLFDVLYAASTD